MEKRFENTHKEKKYKTSEIVSFTEIGTYHKE